MHTTTDEIESRRNLYIDLSDTHSLIFLHCIQTFLLAVSWTFPGINLQSLFKYLK